MHTIVNMIAQALLGSYCQKPGHLAFPSHGHSFGSPSLAAFGIALQCVYLLELHKQLFLLLASSHWPIS